MTRLLALFALAAPAVDPHGDPLPDGAVARFGTVRFRVGSERVCHSHALSPDGKLLAAEDRDGISLWDTETGRVVRRLPGRTWQGDRPNFDLCFSPDGKFLARMAGRVVAVWDLTTGQELFDIDYKDQGKFRGIAYLPGGKQLLVTSERDSRGWVLDARTGKVLRTVEFGGKYSALAPAGPFVLGYAEKTWVLFDPETGKGRVRFPATEQADETIQLTPDGKRAWVCTSAGRVWVVDTETGKTMKELDTPAGWEDGRCRVAVSPDGAVVYLGGDQRVIHRWGAKARKWLPPVTGAPAGRLIPHPDGKRLLVLGDDGVLRRYDLATLRQLPGPDGFEDRLFAYPSPDGRRVLTHSSESGRGRLALFDLTGRTLWSIGSGDLYGPQWCPDGRLIACVGVRETTLRDAATGKVVRTLGPPGPGDQFNSEAYFRPGEGRMIVSVNTWEALAEFEWATGKQTALIRTGSPWKDDWSPLFGELSPDGRKALFTTREGGLRLLDLATGRLTARGPDPPREDRRPAAYAPRFSPDGSYLLTWETERSDQLTFVDKTIAVVRDPVTLAAKREFEADKPGAAGAFAFSPDGLWLAIGHGGGRWSLWDVPTGERVGRWGGHRDLISSIAFAGPGRVLTASGDLTALLWDPRPKARPTKPPWEALSGKEATEAYRAVWALAADPAGPDLLREKVKVPRAVPAEKVRRWIAELGADRFAVREAATKALQELGRVAEPELRAARAAATAEEVRSRLDALLTKISRERTGAEVVQARAVLALELAGTEAAKKVLAEWAAGPAGARVTIDAKAALRRLAATR